MPRLLLSLLLSLAIVITGCSGGTSTDGSAGGPAVPGATDGGVRDGLAELQAAIKLEFEPEEVVWTVEERAGGVGDADSEKKVVTLTAVLRFEGEQAKAFADSTVQYGEGQSVTVEVEDWFPLELIARAQLSSDNTVKGRAFPADRFFRAPFGTGRLVRVEGSDFYLLQLAGS